ncbi:MAG: acyltransferase family protein [Lachnospiraceae bacterium]
MKERIYLFDNMKCLLIILVVFGHLLDPVDSISSIFEVLYYFIYFFHMPAFIFISGYFSKNVERCRDTALQQLLIPYVIFTVLYYIQYYMLYDDPSKPVARFRLFNPSRGLWFLLALIIWKLLLKDLIRIRGIVPLLFFVSILSGVSHEFTENLTMGRIMNFSIFFVAGYYCQWKHIERIRRIPKVLAYVMMSAVVLLAWYLSQVSHMPIESLLMRTYYRDGYLFTDMMYRILILAVAFLMIGCLLCCIPDKKNRLSRVGQTTLLIYLGHLPIVRMTEELSFFERFEQSVWVYSIYLCILTVLIMFVFSRESINAGYHKILNKIGNLVWKEQVNES